MGWSKQISRFQDNGKGSILWGDFLLTNTSIEVVLEEENIRLPQSLKGFLYCNQIDLIPGNQANGLICLSNLSAYQQIRTHSFQRDWTSDASILLNGLSLSQ